MADRICGQPSNLTTVSAGGGGNVRVTYQPWELDWEFFDAIAIGHWLANTTTGVSDVVVAKGGAERLGYWFEISTAFPDANWNTGNRIAPQRQAAINQYNTFAAAVAAMANNDALLVWYQSTSNRRLWSEETIAFAGKGGDVWGMTSRCQITASHTSTAQINFSGNLAGMAIQAKVRNLTLAGRGPGVYYSPAAGFSGAGVDISRSIFCSGSYYAIFVQNTTTANTVLVSNCFIFGGHYTGIWLNVNPQLVYNCTIVFGGVVGGAGLVGSAARNLVGVESLLCFAGAANCRNCADTDGTLPVHATNLRNQDPRTQLRLFYDLASPGQKKFSLDGRIDRSSVLRGAGVALAAVPFDADHQTRPDPPSIGAYEPYAVCYAPAGELIRGASKRGVIA